MKAGYQGKGTLIINGTLGDLAVKPQRYLEDHGT